MNNNDYREITEDDVTTVSTDQKEEMNGQESVNDTPDVSENEKETVQAEVTNSDASNEKEPGMRISAISAADRSILQER